MNFRDLISMSLGNLWRMKLRSALTIAGVVIGIAALVSMMSFGAGMQKNVAQSFRSYDLFNTLQVLSTRMNREDSADSVKTRPLNDEALREISAIPGVRSVYPEDFFPIRVELGGKSVNATAQALPGSVASLSAYSELAAGRFFRSDSVPEVVLRTSLLRRLGVQNPDSVIGCHITLISAGFDRQRVLGSLMTGGRLNPFSEIRYDFTVCGVLELTQNMGGMTQGQLLLPIGAASSLERLNFSNPFDLLSGLAGNDADQYAALTVRSESVQAFEAVRDSIESLGYQTFSFADLFDDIKKGLLIFDAVLGVVGFIALVVASLGIVNTMVMSIMERYHEIGIMKSLGAQDSQIRLLFLVESGVIGLIGALVGLLFGWVITRIGSLLAGYLMEKQGAPRMELFDLPLWLVVLALAFGIVVSLAAGLYPAVRAMRVDPVKALRHE